jgi:hypothetical protein
MTDSLYDPESAPATAVAPARTPKGTFPKGVSGNPAGRAKGSRNKITLVRLETEEALRDMLAPRAKKLLRKAMAIAMDDKHPGQTKMLTTLLDKTLSSLRNEDVGEAKDTNVVVNINDLTSIAARRRAPPATDAEFTAVPALPATISIPVPTPTKTSSEDPTHAPDHENP